MWSLYGPKPQCALIRVCQPRRIGSCGSTPGAASHPMFASKDRRGSNQFAVPRRSLTMWGLLVVVVVSWSSHVVVGFDFVAWDDEYNILVNPHLGPPTPENLVWMFTDQSYMRRYVPFGWFGFSVAYVFSGLSPFAYHLGNLVLHITNAVSLFCIIAWALRRWSSHPDGSKIPPCAAAGALFWAIHPLRAETVGWASGMLYSQACFFALLSVLTYCRAQYERKQRQGSYNVWYWTAFVLYVISMLTYPITIGLVAVFVTIDVMGWRSRIRRGVTGPPPARAILSGCVEKDPSRSLWAEIRSAALAKIPFILSALAVTAVTFFSRVTASSFWPEAPSLNDLSFADRLMRGCYGVVYYLWKTIWPTDLTPLPPRLGAIASYWVLAVLGAMFVCALTILVWKTRRRWPAALPLWGCYVILFAPMLGFTDQSFYLSERYSYLPAMTVSLALAAGMASLPPPFFRPAVIAAIATVAILAFLSSAQLAVWQNSSTLFARAVERAESPQLRDDVYQRCANFYAFRGNVAAAAAVLDGAEEQGVSPSVLNEMRANLAQSTNELYRGTAPLVARIHEALAIRLARQDRMCEADKHFAEALALAPHAANLRYNHSLFAAGRGDARTALHSLLIAISHSDVSISVPAQQNAWSLVALAFERNNEVGLARHAMKRASNAAGSKSEPTAVSDIP
jgi:protein O-mannosyl-transferase